MRTVTKRISIQTKGEDDIIDITKEVANGVRAEGLKNGIVTVFIPGSTGGITTIEYEPGLLNDFPAMLERLAPSSVAYEHDRRWHDGNGHSHVRASILGPSMTIPFENGELTLGTWQQLVFVECDIRSRKRELIIQIMGE